MDIFIYRKGALGDTISFLPLLFNLRYFYRKIYFAGNYLYRELFQDIDFIEFLDADSKDVFNCINGCIPEYLKSVQKFHIFSDQNFMEQQNFFYYKAIQNNIWFYEYPFYCLNLQFTECPIFLPLINYPDFTNIIKSDFILIHPGSGGIKKIWPIENFFEFEEIVNKRGYKCIYLLGEAEENLIEKMDNRVFFYNLSLKKVCFLLTYAIAYLGCDSGISHLAGIMNAKGVALFGPSSAKIYKPWGNIRVLESREGNIFNITTGDVITFFDKGGIF